MGKAAFPGLDQRLVGQSKLLVGFTAHFKVDAETKLLVGFTAHFKVDAESYNRLAAAARGLYPTWEGVLLQLFAFVFVIGSYVAAEAVRQRRPNRAFARGPARSAPLRDHVR